MSQIVQGTPIKSPAEDWNKAAGLLEQAVRVGSKDQATTYLLAMCYKRLGRHADARTTLSKIADPDANVFLQSGLLAYTEKDYAQAEIDFARSFEMEPSYAAGYHLLLARLCRKKRQEAAGALETLAPLAPSPGERRFLELLRILLMTDNAGKLPFEWQQMLASISTDEEARLVDMLTGIEEFEVVLPLLQMLAQLRPGSSLIWQATFQAGLAHAKDLVDRCLWKEALNLLEPMTRAGAAYADKLDLAHRLALFNMLGVCACMVQEYERGIAYFRSALELHQKSPDHQSKQPQVNSLGINQQAWLEQNLALAHEWLGKLDRAESHWNRYFDCLELSLSNAKGWDYLTNLAFEGLSRLADVCTQKERWDSALGFLLRAHKFRPTDADVLERLFHLYEQLHMPEESRRILQQLHEMRPNDVQVELFELNNRDVRDIDDLAKLLADIRRILQKFAGNPQVEERISSMIANLLPFMDRLFEQWNAQMNKVQDQLRRLPSYQINWPMVREVTHELEDKFFQLRKSAGKAQSLVQGSLRRDLQRLASQCDRKMEQCHSLGE